MIVRNGFSWFWVCICIACIPVQPHYQHHVFDSVLVIVSASSFGQRGWPATSGAWLGHSTWIFRWVKLHLQTYRLCLLTELFFFLFSVNIFAWNLEISKGLANPKNLTYTKNLLWNLLRVVINVLFGFLIIFEINIMS